MLLAGPIFSFFQSIFKVSINLNSVIWWIKFDSGRSVVYLALENGWLFTTPPLVSPRNDMWATTEEIPYWWHSLFRSGYRSWLVEVDFSRNRTNQKHYSEPGSDTMSVWNFCSLCSDVILQETWWWWSCKMFAVFSCLVVNCLSTFVWCYMCVNNSICMTWNLGVEDSDVKMQDCGLV